jgi:predicted transcriptional regulator
VSGAVGRRLVAAAPFTPAALLVVLWLAWVPADGGYFGRSWYPGALGVVAVLTVTVVSGRRALPPGRPARVALAALAALTVLSAASILWAGSRADAWEAADQLGLLLATAWCMALLPWTGTALAATAAAWSCGVAAYCAIRLGHAVGASDLTPWFSEDRWSDPTGYPNAAAAITVLAAWPAVAVAARRELSPWAQGPLLGVAAFLAGHAILPQSRGAVVAGVISVLAAMALARERVALAARLAVLGAGLAVTWSRLVAVATTASDGGTVGPSLHRAAAALLVMSVAVAVAGAGVGLAERALMRRRGVARRLPRRAWAVAGGVGVLAVAALALALGGRGVSFVRAEFHRANATSGSGGSTRLFSTDPEERADYARVAIRLFDGRPVAGVGAGNFGRAYDARRRYAKHSLYTHDIWLRALSEGGIIGLALLVALCGALAAGLVAARARLRGAGGAVAALVAGAGTYFLVHASLDWLDEFPALAAPVIGVAFAATVIGYQRRPGAGRWRRTHTALAIAAAAGALVALGLPYLSLRYTERALDGAAANPAGAYRDLRRAADLNPLSSVPALAEGTIAVRRREPARARRAFERALARERTWYAELELGLLDAHAGRFAAAARRVRAASQLDAADPVLAEARAAVRHRRRIDPARFNARALSASPVFRRERLR